MAGSARVDLRAGGEYRWTVTPGHVAAGTYREVEPGRRVVFGWGWEGSADLAPDASTVTITIEPTATGSSLTLVHEGLTTEQAAHHAEGWSHFLERLERLAVAGDAGPDEWAALPDPLTPISAAYASLAVLQPVLRGLTDGERTAQTPCAAYTCHDLAEHLFGSLVGLGRMAGASVVEPEEGSLEDRMSVLADQALEAWSAVDLDGTVPGPGGEMPAVVGAVILSIEFLLHAWDFAQASGQQVVVADGLVEYVVSAAGPVIEGARGRGAFADAVEPAAGASALERFAAYSGRTPVAA